jgi:hypothetical protein
VKPSTCVGDRFEQAAAAVELAYLPDRFEE